MKDNLTASVEKNNYQFKKNYNIEVLPSPSDMMKKGNNISLNNLNNFTSNTNNILFYNNLGYINDENSNAINSTKLRFENLEEELEDKNKKTKNNLENIKVRLDMGIVNTYIRSKTQKEKIQKINTSSDTI